MACMLTPPAAPHYRSVSRRDARKQARAFKGAKRALVVVAAAEPAAPAPAPQQQPAPRGRRPQREVTVQMDALKPGSEFEGTVVSISEMAFVGEPQLAGNRTAGVATQPAFPWPPLQTSVEAYGAFVNIGADMDGLVHVSQLKVRSAAAAARRRDVAARMPHVQRLSPRSPPPLQHAPAAAMLAPAGALQLLMRADAPRHARRTAM